MLVMIVQAAIPVRGTDDSWWATNGPKWEKRARPAVFSYRLNGPEL